MTANVVSHTILCSWLVWSLPRSPMLVRHTMSSLPMEVACRSAAGLERASALGLRQYRYCLVSCGLTTFILPNTSVLESGKTLFIGVTEN